MDKYFDKLWQNYRKSRDEKSILKLINAYMPLLQIIADNTISESFKKKPSDYLSSVSLPALRYCILSYPKDCQSIFEDYATEIIKKAIRNEIKTTGYKL